MKDRFMCRIFDKKSKMRMEPMCVVDCNEDDLIIEQCTGLKDKNGKLTYEGDIISKEFTDRPFSSKAKSKIKNCLICWDDGNGAFSLKCKSDNYRHYSAHHRNPFGDYEIVGNIHENPELLEKEDD